MSARHATRGSASPQASTCSLVDADDWVEPGFIADLVHISQALGADVVVGGFSFDFLGLRLPFPVPAKNGFNDRATALGPTKCSRPTTGRPLKLTELSRATSVGQTSSGTDTDGITT